MAQGQNGPDVGAEARAERDRESETLLGLEPGVIDKSRQTGKSIRELDLLQVVSRVVDRAYRAGRASNGTDLAVIQEEIEQAIADIEPVAERANPYHSDPAKRTHGQEDFQSWDKENSNLRRQLLWLAARPGISLAERRELRERLAGSLNEGGVVRDVDEDAHADFLGVRQSLEALIGLVEEVHATDVPENTMTTTANKRMLPRYWHSRAEDALNRARGRLEEFPELETLARLRVVQA